MLLILSPAKTLDFSPSDSGLQHTQPEFLSKTTQLVDVMRAYNPDDISNLMGISAELARLNYERFLEWAPKHEWPATKPACMAFRGDVYQGLMAETFNEKDLAYAQQHLRILSGLYGVLRPLDLIRPYRLEMGTRLQTNHGRNLYEFWGNTIADALVKAATDGILVNLASQEYFKAAHLESTGLAVYAPVFKDFRGKDYKIISFYAKRARGAMASWVIRNQISTPEDLRAFDWNGYAFSKAHSTPHAPAFLRDHTPARAA